MSPTKATPKSSLLKWNSNNLGKLTTHILDTARGKPAAGVAVTLHRVSGGKRETLGEYKTNNDGRTNTALLEGDNFAAGEYELDFAVGEYFGDGEESFLGVVTVRFRVQDANANYHIPLLTSPYGYTTYRGS